MPVQPQPTCFRAVALAALALFATTAGHAQGLGGMLNKAKAGLNSATATTKATNGSPVQAATQAASQTGGGDLPPRPSTSTVASERAYALACLNDKRPLLMPLSENNSEPNRWYRELVQLEHVPLRFTWDEAVEQLLIENNSGMLWPICEDISQEILRGMGNASDKATLLPLLRKVKQIHFTTSPLPKSAGKDALSAQHGLFCTWNPATGVLTAAISKPSGFNSVANDAFRTVDPWIMQHVK